MANVDVLNLEWSSGPSRDRTAASLVCNYLRYRGKIVREACVHDGLREILRYKPSLVYMSNMIGALVNLEVAKACSKNKIPLISGIAEGNFQDHGESQISQFVWGWNKAHETIDNITLYWSERTRDYAVRYFPELNHHLFVTGACGFDIYRIVQSDLKDLQNRFKAKYRKRGYSKVVGVGCWDFGHVMPEDKRYVPGKYSIEDENRLRSDRQVFRDTLRSIIVDHPEILFILKQHPGVLLGQFASGIDGLERFENVVVLKNEESILDCIRISDFWLVYESTTALEAWMMGKQTCLFNPSGTGFRREEVIYKGSPNYRTLNELESSLHAFYTHGVLPGFSELERQRKDAISKVIQWDDGFNHVRAGNLILSHLDDTRSLGKPIALTLHQRLKTLRWRLSPVLRFLPVLSRYAHPRRNAFIRRQVEQYSKELYKQQVQFYSQCGMDLSALSSIVGL